jgi:hypothetical protein
MRKGWIVLLAGFLVAAFALPAAAQVDLKGFVRTKAWVSNWADYGAGYIVPVDDPATNAYVETRGRLLFQAGNENVRATAFFEIDFMWGDAAYGVTRNQGGGLMADHINLETKQVNVWFRIPDTTVEATVGLLSFTDAYAGVFAGIADTAGVVARGRFGPTDLRLGWMKFWENAVGAADDVDLYVLEAKLDPVPDVKLGLNLYFLNDMSGGAFPASGVTAALPAEITAAGYRSLRVWMPGVDVAFQAGPASLSAFAFYQWGEAEGGIQDVDVRGFAADVRAELDAGPGRLFVEGLYVSGDSNPNDNKHKGIITASHYNLQGSFFFRTDTQTLLVNIDDLNTFRALSLDVANGGAGLIHLAAGYTQTFTDKVRGKVGLAHSRAAEKRPRDGQRNLAAQAHNFANKSDMATEINANVNYNITKGLDFGVYGAYAFLHGAYDLTADGVTAQDPDDLYALYARLNYAF